MNYSGLYISVCLVFSLLIISCSDEGEGDIIIGTADITPNMFEGNDAEKIQSAIDLAKGTTNKVVIPSNNNNGTNYWVIDKAVLLPGNMTLILDNCLIMLSDECRDNMFRTDNVGEGFTVKQWNKDINIIGYGEVILKGAENPRSTGSSSAQLSLTPEPGGNATYGTDAGKNGENQTGDWRNHLILIAYVDGIKIRNITIQNAHASAIAFERTINAEISRLRLLNKPEILINNETYTVADRNGLTLKHGCKNFIIDNVSGISGKDFISLSLLHINDNQREAGIIEAPMVTTRDYKAPDDNIEQIFITNIRSQPGENGIALHAIDYTSIHNVYINGLVSSEIPDYSSYDCSVLVGSKANGPASLPGRINNIAATNIMGNGLSLIQIGAAISNCYFTNGIYSGLYDIVAYNVDPDSIDNVLFENLYKVK